MRVKYILRFDDIHPKMRWDYWHEIEELMIKYNIKPILAVIPDNRDKKLIYSDGLDDYIFWEKMKEYQSLGWTIAMHGYQHLYTSNNRGDFVRINSYSEFAGLSEELQSEKIRLGLEIFKKYGLSPSMFVAPAHTFDKTTVRVLKKYGFKMVSDGFYFYPVVIDDMLFIPQQLWWFKRRSFGLYTICFHHNYWTYSDLHKFKQDLTKFKDHIISVNESLKFFKPRSYGFFEKLSEISFHSLFYLKTKLKKIIYGVKNK